MKPFLVLAGMWPVMLLFAACADSFAKRPVNETGEIANTVTAVTVTAVDVAWSGEGPFEYLVNASGKIRSLKDQLIYAGGDGKVMLSKASPGAGFREGELIVQLETALISLRRERALISQYNAEKEYESQLLGYENLLRGQDSSFVSNIRKNLRISSGLSGAEQDLKESDFELSRSVIRAPFDCRVADVGIQSGAVIRGGQQLFRVYDPSCLVVEIKVLEAEVGALKPGAAATVVAIAAPLIKYAAFVYDINPYIDENGMALVRLKVKGDDHLFPGMNCRVSVRIPSGMTVTVPKEAIVMRGGKPVVFTVENGLARWHYVTTGRENGREVEIKEGLSGTVPVVISNNLQLANDTPVDTTSANKTKGDE